MIRIAEPGFIFRQYRLDLYNTRLQWYGSPRLVSLTVNQTTSFHEQGSEPVWLINRFSKLGLILGLNFDPIDFASRIYWSLSVFYACFHNGPILNHLVYPNNLQTIVSHKDKDISICWNILAVYLGPSDSLVDQRGGWTCSLLQKYCQIIGFCPKNGGWRSPLLHRLGNPAFATGQFSYFFIHLLFHGRCCYHKSGLFGINFNHGFHKLDEIGNIGNKVLTPVCIELGTSAIQFVAYPPELTCHLFACPRLSDHHIIMLF